MNVFVIVFATPVAFVYAKSAVFTVPNIATVDNNPVPNVIIQVGSWICMIVFSIRVIGEFNYFGIFKRQKDTHFARMDTGLYIPLCAFLSLSFLLAIIL